MPRRSIDTPSYSHAAAIPTASRVGPILASSIIAGLEPGTRTMPPDAEAQAANVMRHAAAILEAGGASWNDVVKMTFFVAAPELRTVIEPLWVEHFPDPSSRPARHIQTTAVPRGVQVQAELLAYVED